MKNKSATEHPLSLLIMVLGGGGLVLGVLAAILGILLAAAGNRKASLLTHTPGLLLRDRTGLYLDEVENDQGLFGFWPLPEEIPVPVQLALLGAEDKRFFQHEGIDASAVLRAWLQNRRAGQRISGASTIPMQVIRMEHPASRTLWNKLAEAWAARMIIRRYGHNKVLRHYLTIAPFGNRVHGIAYAAEKYFYKPVQDLSLAEATLLLAIPQHPNRMNLYDPAGRYLALERAERILENLYQSGMIEESEYNLAGKELQHMPVFLPDQRPVYAMHYIMRVRQNLGTPQGTNIWYCSIDLSLQKKIAVYLRKYVESRYHRGVGNAAFMLTDIHSGEVLVYVGSSDYQDQEHKGAIDYCQIPRSSGSILKPFIYALGMIERGFTGATVLSDTGLYLSSGGTLYTPENSDRQYEGPVLYRYALANSRNVPAVQLVNEIGVQPTYRFLEYLGLLDVNQSADYYGLSVAIGGLYVRLDHVLRAYGILARDGQEYTLQWFRQDTTPSSARQVLPADISRMISLFLSDPQARTPTFPRQGSLEYPFAVAIKTGTSQGFRDAWTVAYTHRYLLGAWTGHPDNAKMDRMGGSGSSAWLIRYAMNQVHPQEMQGQKDLPFDPPPGFIARNICRISGKLARPDTGSYITEWFRPGTEPVEYSDVYKSIVIDKRTGGYADRSTPPAWQEKRVVVFLDQKYAEWARQNGFTLPPMENSLAQLSPQDMDAGRITILEPADGLRFYINPAQDRAIQTIALRAQCDPPAAQVVWYVNGRPWQVAEHPYTLRWPLTSGIHTFQVRSAHTPLSSKIITITVE